MERKAGHLLLVFLLMACTDCYFENFEYSDVSHEVITPLITRHSNYSQKILLTFRAYNQDFSFRLRENADILTQDFDVIVINKEGESRRLDLERRILEDGRRCQFYLSDQTTTAATVSVCGSRNGRISGIVSVNASTYLIRFDNRTDGLSDQHLIYHYEDVPCVQGSCLDTEPIQKLKDYVKQRSVTLERRVWSTDPKVTLKYVELGLIFDVEAMARLEASKQDVTFFTLKLINYMSSMYSKLEISIILKRLILWLDKNQIPMYDDIEDTIISFADYNIETYHRNRKLDATVLISGHRFVHSPGILGVAFKGKTCESPELAVSIISMGPEAEVRDVAGIATHELGHSLGFDDEWYHKASHHCYSECQDAEDKTSCIMRGKYTSGSHSWSQCTKDRVKEREVSQRFACLYNQPNVSQVPVCGNGLIEMGEDCDCITNSTDCRDCCDRSTCKLKAPATCSNELCCQSCHVVQSNRTCRPPVDPLCDEADTCDGVDAKCFDRRKADETECGVNKWCIAGHCEHKCLNDCYGSGDCIISDGESRCSCRSLTFGRHCQHEVTVGTLLEIACVSFVAAFVLTFLLFVAVRCCLRR